MRITITFDYESQAQRDEVRALLTRYESEPDVAPVEKPAPVAKTALTEAPAPVEKPIEMAPITIEMVRAELGRLVQTGQRDKVHDILSRFNTAKVSDLAECDYAAVITACKEV